MIITDQDEGIRLDKLLSQHYPEHSRSYFQHLIDDGHVLLNGEMVKKQHRPEVGDVVEVEFHKPPQLDVKPEPIPLDILYEDEHMIVINKPKQMVVHPAPGAYTGTFANALLFHCKELENEPFEELRPGIVHRLDKDTTGVLIGAKTLDAHKRLTQLFASREVEKTYLAICCGVPKEGTFSAPIQRNPRNRKQMIVREEGKEAISEFTILGKNEAITLVQIGLITGRTHQIRVHLKAQNAPVLGDPTYGSLKLNEKYQIYTQLLHAHKIKIKHPFSGASLELVAPPPLSMKNFIDLIHHP